jgi:DivIVA domain-containing protein
MAELNYTTQQILQQQFKTKMRGYDPEEVDEYLDNIIRDYEAMQKEILSLREENDRLHAQVEKLSKQAPVASPTRPVQEAPKSTTVTNFDILKRLSNLEREVFGNKLDAQGNNVPKTRVPQAPVSPSAFVEPAIDDQDTRLI